MKVSKVLTAKTLGALLLNSIYIVSALGKITGFKETVDSLKSVFWIKNLPDVFYNFTIAAVIVLLLVGPGLILYTCYDSKYKMYAKYACYALALFTILATLLYHMPVDMNQRNHMLKNIAIIGGFILLSSTY